MKSLKAYLRQNSLAKALFKQFKLILVFPLRFTSLKTLQLSNFPLKDLFNPKKTSLLKVAAPYTKAGYPRLTNVYDLSNEIEKKNIDGAFVECGTWKGGCAAIMAAIAHRYGDRRTTWYFDSFEGMPEPTPEDGTNEETDHMMGDYLAASEADVEELIFDKLKLPREKNILVKGWFEKTLPARKADIGKIAILRLDADWYSSTVTILEELYSQVVSGGYLIFDDYSRWQGCKQATDEFIKKNDLKVEFQWIGTYGKRVMYFQKP